VGGRGEGEEAVTGVVGLVACGGVWGRARDGNRRGFPTHHAADLLCVFVVHPRLEVPPPDG
jgi:hypothetical protein